MSQQTAPAATPAPIAEAPVAIPDPAAKPDKAPKASRADFLKGLNAELGIGKKENATVRGGMTLVDGKWVKNTADAAPTNDAETPAEEPASEVREDSEETPAEDPPAEPTKEEPKQYAHKLAALQLEAQRAKSDSLKSKDAHSKAAARVTDLEAQLEALKDARAALKHAGTDPLAFAQQLIDGKISIDDVKTPERDPEVQALIDEGKKAKDRAAQEAAAAEARAVRTENVKLVKGAIDAPGFADRFPLVAAMPDAAETMLTWIEAGMEANGGQEPSFEQVAQLVQENTLKETLAYLKHAGARATILKDPDLAKLLRAVEETVAEQAQEEAPAVEAPPAPAAAPAKKAAPQPKKPTTLTTKNTSATPSRTSKASSSADLAASINRTIMAKQT